MLDLEAPTDKFIFSFPRNTVVETTTTTTVTTAPAAAAQEWIRRVTVS